MLRVLFKYFLSYDVKIFLNLVQNKLVLVGKLGHCFIYLPKYFMFYILNNNFHFLFFIKEYFVSFIKHFFYMYNRVVKLFFFKLRLRGMGYYIKRMSDCFYKIFVANNHFFYFYVPNNVYIRRRGRDFFFI